METLTHGGNVYAENAGLLDFSANLNPLGMPDCVRLAAQQSIARCERYPDPLCRALRCAIAERERCASTQIFCGNGASDVLVRLALALRPKHALVAQPTFAEYARAVHIAGGACTFYALREQDGFALTEKFLHALTPEIDAVFLCSPNNPTGLCIALPLLHAILKRCEQIGAVLVLDESFLDFVEDAHSAIAWMKHHPRLVLVRSMTKMYAMPGIRVGYCLSADEALIARLYDMGQPWAVSVTAQQCGAAAARDVDTPVRTRPYITRRREWLLHQLRQLGLRVVDGQANFLLLHSDWKQNLADALHARGILVRRCANYPGLDEHWFRIAVRTERENEQLVNALRGIRAQEETQCM